MRLHSSASVRLCLRLCASMCVWVCVSAHRKWNVRTSRRKKSLRPGVSFVQGLSGCTIFCVGGLHSWWLQWHTGDGNVISCTHTCIVEGRTPSILLALSIQQYSKHFMSAKISCPTVVGTYIQQRICEFDADWHQPTCKSKKRVYRCWYKEACWTAGSTSCVLSDY